MGPIYLSTSIMAEITNEIEWLKACNHLVFENYADVDAWGWDGYTSDTMSDVLKTAKHLWRLGREEYYEYFNPIHRAIFGCLCWHMNPEIPPEGAIPPWATENLGIDHYRTQLERLFLKLDCPLTWIPEDEEAEVQPVEVEPVAVEVAPPPRGGTSYARNSYFPGAPGNS